MPSTLHGYRLIAALLLYLFISPIISASDEAILMPSPPVVIGSSYILEDFNSHKVIVEKNSDKTLSPASLTKIMTAYVVFSEIKKGKLSLTDKVTVSENAWKMPGSRMFIEVGTQVMVEDLLKGLIIQSGNDASVALAEHIAGNEANFVLLMNEQAQRLKLINTHFQNSMGLPTENHHTTAKDLILLTRALITDFPEYYVWESQKEFTYNNIKQRNRNRLLWKDSSVDGVKTGHTNEAGYCMVASAKRDNMRLISVVMGAKSESARTAESQGLLNYGFRFYETHRLYQAQQSLKKVRIWKGERKELKLGVEKDLYITIAKRYYENLKIETKTDKKIIAPVIKGQVYGAVTITLKGELIKRVPLIALEDIAIGSIFQRFYDHLLQLIE
ncbi:MAG: D-alanyl-D-alanine carboxypeptidase family protein [Methylococcales bacterium]|nr:D-alanyl-D-alanine carboxypeptidase family protein [Methylococcales bacterium]